MEHLKPMIGRSFDTPSAYGRWLAPRLHAVYADGLGLAFTVRDDMTNPGGTLHGGVAAGILDETLGAAVAALRLFHRYASLDLNVDFIAFARPGDEVVARARVVRHSKRLAWGAGELSLGDGTLIARATAKLIRIGG